VPNPTKEDKRDKKGEEETRNRYTGGVQEEEKTENKVSLKYGCSLLKLIQQ
jgi:hypothetical protein